MHRKRYLMPQSMQAHQSMVSTFIKGMQEHWGNIDVHVSCDTAIARGVAESRLELIPMIAWDAFIGARQIRELIQPAHRRTYHRYLPFPRSVRDSLDEWAIAKLMISLHHQLLTGVVIYVDPGEFTSDELDALESSVIRKQIVLLASGHYWRKTFDVNAVTARQSKPIVEDMFARIWEAQRSPQVMKLLYSYPQTFEPSRYFPGNVREFIVFAQKERCPCSNGCYLGQSWDVDHVVPVSQGGTNVLINLQATCREYNRERKQARPEPRPVSYDAIMTDPIWKPKISKKYTALLLNQRFESDALSKIKGLYDWRVRSTR